MPGSFHVQFNLQYYDVGGPVLLGASARARALASTPSKPASPGDPEVSSRVSSPEVPTPRQQELALPPPQ